MARNSIPLRDDALVVRFNLAEVDLFRKALNRCLVHRHYYGLSFAGDNDLPAEEIARLFPFPSDWMAVSSMGRFREAGWEPIREGGYPHLALRFLYRPTDEELKLLVSLFDDPVENPHPR